MMRLCEICGNEIDDDVTRCPYCKSLIERSATRRNKGASAFVTVNLKMDLPTAAEALRRLGVKLDTARVGGAKVVRVIHGWGSAGSGGKIKKAVHIYLRSLERRGRIRSFIAGEDYSELSERGRDLLSACPVLKNSLRTDRLNKGITLVDL